MPAPAPAPQGVAGGKFARQVSQFSFQLEIYCFDFSIGIFIPASGNGSIAPSHPSKVPLWNASIMYTGLRVCAVITTPRRKTINEPKGKQHEIDAIGNDGFNHQ
ncbi:hypothetical protein PO883_06880 [Massilia sp. DJPM01]|uniref:hypothetical protein n=1 Tax=Massilia sp. DJPM01 TaxID=3024404 RepID=UPI00259E5E74|nr:hypothetical protein [Massilia sp. DJPM01]MDM5176921.1 hypothetical protein [Massilia sp. DJPM01]